jgi:hypothetical protein
VNDDPTDPPGLGSLPLPEGDHEVMVVDVEQQLDQAEDAINGAEAELSLVVLKGPLKGQVVSLRYPSAGGDLLRLLGTHGILRATDRGLSLRLED